ncbi:oxysterol-binding protein-related protein 4C-like [Iris pallida]|uniref:Oxysterol-binding protein-related protein 4C-like n=2 Tax=Iris pallida TaxID=29817 RepID=A0AAX6F7W2_IRIPA|nr:oxysterol-binding protein-related protein 4C-like [Iris pallida]
MQLPPLFNLPKSHLQCYGESVYCFRQDLLTRCGQGKTPLERFTSVVAWSISTTRPGIFGLAPYNPILGETHHVTNGTLNVLLEQVSHHPPVSALHATDAKENIELLWCQSPVPKFKGTSVEAVIRGKRQLWLQNFAENYKMDSPKLQIKIFPVPSADWVGDVSIRCKKSSLEAVLSFYKSQSFLGFGGNSRAIKGKIFHSKTLRTIFEVDGHWDRTVTLKDIHNGKVTVLYDAKEVISKLNTPVVNDPKGLWPSESAVVWSELTQSILKGDWEKASAAKRGVEERQRSLRRERKSTGEDWVPKHFKLGNTKEGVWECWPIEQAVPPAPIIVPVSNQNDS